MNDGASALDSPTCPVCGSADCAREVSDRRVRGVMYRHCRMCGSGFVDARAVPAADTAEAHRRVYYNPENEGPDVVHAAESFFLDTLKSYKNSGRLLDIGCGRGRWLAAIRDSASFEVEGLEPVEAAAQWARERYGLTVRTGVLEEGMYPEAAFDVVYLRHVLEHVDAPGSFIREVTRILKPGGLAAVHVPNDASLTNAVKRRLYRIGVGDEYGSLFHPLHITGFTPTSLTALFRNTGCAALRMVTIAKTDTRYEFPPAWFDKIMLPVYLLERCTSRGNLLCGWFEKITGADTR